VPMSGGWESTPVLSMHVLQECARDVERPLLPSVLLHKHRRQGLNHAREIERESMPQNKAQT
jgi:hypothetical protein